MDKKDKFPKRYDSLMPFSASINFLLIISEINIKINQRPIFDRFLNILRKNFHLKKIEDKLIINIKAPGGPNTIT